MTSTTIEALTNEREKYIVKYDFGKVKAEFYERLKTLNRRILDKSRLTKFLRMIREAKKNKSEGHLLSREQSRVLNLFDVIENKSNPVLIKARKDKNDPIQIYVTCEDSFDILSEAHLSSNHGGRDKMVKKIGKKYVINIVLVNLMLQVCNVCSARRMKEQIVRVSATHPDDIKRKRDRRIVGRLPNFNARCFVFLIDMSSEPDEPFRYIMIVRDASTGFTQIRPTISADQTEVAVELLKIFTDFGPPSKIVVNNLSFFHEVLEIMTNLYPYFSAIAIERVKTSLQGWANQIQYYLNEWIRVKKTKHWAIGCYMIQWSINNTIEFKQLQTPFTGVFGSCYRDPLQCFTSDNDVIQPSNPPVSNSMDIDLTDAMSMDDNDELGPALTSSVQQTEPTQVTQNLQNESEYLLTISDNGTSSVDNDEFCALLPHAPKNQLPKCSLTSIGEQSTPIQFPLINMVPSNIMLVAVNQDLNIVSPYAPKKQLPESPLIIRSAEPTVEPSKSVQRPHKSIDDNDELGPALTSSVEQSKSTQGLQNEPELFMTISDDGTTSVDNNEFSALLPHAPKNQLPKCSLASIGEQSTPKQFPLINMVPSNIMLVAVNQDLHVVSPYAPKKQLPESPLIISSVEPTVELSKSVQRPHNKTKHSKTTSVAVNRDLKGGTSSDNNDKIDVIPTYAPKKQVTKPVTSNVEQSKSIDGSHNETTPSKKTLEAFTQDIENMLPKTVVMVVNEMRPEWSRSTKTTVNDKTQEILSQENAGKISVVSLEISDNEMDIDEVKEIIMCRHCELEIKEPFVIHCERCEKSVHKTCCKKLMLKNELGIACFTCLDEIKRRIETLKAKFR